MSPEYRFRTLLKPIVFVISLFPLFWLILQVFTVGLGANPVEKLLHHMGDWTLNFLMITLAISPLNKFTGLTWLLRLRRMTGLVSFFYASLHFLTYVGLDQFFAWDAIIEDIMNHRRIIIGLATYTLLVPLAVTSSNNMIQRLGFSRWQSLHRLTYAVAIGGVIHYLFLVKKDMRTPLIYAGILALLFGIRAVLKVRKGNR